MLYKTNATVAQQFSADPQRGRHFSLRQGHWWLDYSRLRMNPDQRRGLFDLIASHALGESVQRLFDGAIVNPSEKQPALHMALRAAEPGRFPGADPERDLVHQRDRFLDLAGELHEGRRELTDLVHLGIGGSDLGPRLVADALTEADGRVRVHWLSTLDGRGLDHLLRRLDPRTTGVLIASKSFSTEETLTQALALRDWLGDRFGSQAWAATANHGRAVEFGVAADAVLPFPPWTGGRYSLWSSVGFSAAVEIGPARFRALLAGAAQADGDVLRAPDERSIAIMLALIMHYLRRVEDHNTLGVIAYDPRLGLLSDYLQQLVMESLGKGVDLADRPLDRPTSPLIFGGRGTDMQHSIFQALHQAPDTHPLLLVGSLADHHAWPQWHRVQFNHLLAQATAFARGRQSERGYQVMPGERPVSLLVTESLTPQALGWLLATFEHAVYALSVVWDINPFDQWGVEEGKRLAGRFRDLDADSLDEWLETARAMLSTSES
jgi:glucose-6-phosphate isomerase